LAATGILRSVEETEQGDAELTSELLELRRELVELRPELDDRGMEPVGEGSPGTTAPGNDRTTLAFFDEVVRGEPDPFNADGVGGRAGTLLWILESKDSGPWVRPVRDAGGVGESPPDPVDLWRRRAQARSGARREQSASHAPRR
jgi:hypothetical protein